MKEDYVFWLALLRIFNNQPIIAKLLLDKFGTPREIFKNKSSFKDIKEVYQAVDSFCDWNLCEQDLAFLEKEGARLLVLTDPDYPKLLKEIYDPPILLMIKGERPEILDAPCVAIVGARKATEFGKEVAFDIASEIASRGVVVVSGMAYGIDSAAHRGAMATGLTIAVWGSGLDCCYPYTSLDLSKKIMQNGCVITEFPPQTLPHRSNFPQRNRIISGLCLGTVIVEAASKSGSLITAKLALEQGREVFAVPGRARGVMWEGNNRLIKSGAPLVDCGEDILNAISAHLPAELKNPRHLSRDVNNGRAVLDLIEPGSVRSLDSIIENSKISCPEVLREITELTIAGLIEELPGKQFRRKK